MAPFSGTYSYSLATSTTAPGEAAEASVKIAVRVGGAVPTGWTDVVDSCSSAPNCNHATNGQVPFAFTATLPAAKDTMMTVAISDPAGIAVAMGQPLVALGNILFVDEGQSGTSMFTVENQGGDAMISAISVTQGLTQGDPMDWANIAGVGGSCMTGNVLAAGATCSVLVDFLTDTADYGPGLDGITPFDLMFSLDDGRMAIATALVGVVDTPESASLALMVAGLAVVVLRRRKRG